MTLYEKTEGFSFRFRSWFSFTDVSVFTQYREHEEIEERETPYQKPQAKTLAPTVEKYSHI